MPKHICELPDKRELKFYCTCGKDWYLEDNEWKKMRGLKSPTEGKCSARIKGCMEREMELRYCSLDCGWGTTHVGVGACKLHGGSTPTAIKSASRKIVRKELATERASVFAEEEIEPVGDPEMVYLHRMAKQLVWEEIIESKVAELSSLEAVDAKGTEQIKAVIQLWEESKDRTNHMLEFAQKHDLRKKKQEIEARHATLLAQVLETVILSHQLRLTDEQVETAGALLAAELTKYAPQLQPAGFEELAVLDAEVVDGES